MLSVIIPSRVSNRDLRTLQTLRNQDMGGEGSEVIVVADGAELSAAASLRGNPLPFDLRVIEQRHTGQAAARNRGVAAARHAKLVFLDDDMALNPGFLRAMNSALDAGADVALATIRIGSWVPSTRYSREVRIWEEGQRASRSAGVPFNVMFFAAAAVRREAFEAVGGFDESFTLPGRYGNEDLDLGYRLVKAGARVEQVREAVAHTDLVTDEQALLTRSRLSGQADVRLALKHPELREALFSRRIASSRIHRSVAGAVGALPGVGGVAAPLHVLLATLERWRPDGPLAHRFWYTARALRYWQGVVEGGGRALRPSIFRARRGEALTGEPERQR